jgi:late competence protein required for DNA uptake (superfamily II DNA/RNA helicase)
MKDTIKSIVLVGIMAIAFCAVKVIKALKPSKKKYICNKCGCKIRSGQGVILTNGKAYFFCRECIKGGKI